MASKSILIEEFHVSIRAPRGLRDAEYAAMRRTLDDRGFQAELRRAISRCSRNAQIKVASNCSNIRADGAALSLCAANSNSDWKL